MKTSGRSSSSSAKKTTKKRKFVVAIPGKGFTNFRKEAKRMKLAEKDDDDDEEDDNDDEWKRQYWNRQNKSRVVMHS